MAGKYDNEECVCGMTYARFRTKLNFREVRMMLHVPSNNPKDWKYKRRRCVLRLWARIKRSLWREHQELCEAHEEWFSKGGRS